MPVYNCLQIPKGNMNCSIDVIKNPVDTQAVSETSSKFVEVRQLSNGVSLKRDITSDKVFVLKDLSFVESSQQNKGITDHLTSCIQLKHPNIAQLLSIESLNPRDANGQDKGCELTAVSEFIIGSPLSDMSRHFLGNKVKFDKAIAVCRQIASALDYAHKNGITHGALKPSNIIIESSGTVKLVSLGMSAAGVYTGTNKQVTSPYSAPEHLVNTTVSARADQYSLAIIFHELITGSLPFSQSDPEINFEQIVHSVVPCPDELSDAQWCAMQTALTKDPLGRHESCQHLITLLSGAMANTIGSPQKKKIVNQHKKKKSRQQLINTLRKTVYYSILGFLVYYGYQNYDSIIAQFTTDKKYGSSYSSNNSRQIKPIKTENSILAYLRTFVDSIGKPNSGQEKEESIDTSTQYNIASESFKNAEKLMYAGQGQASLILFKQSLSQLETIHSQTDEGWRLSALNRKIEECEDNIDALKK